MAAAEFHRRAVNSCDVAVPQPRPILSVTPDQKADVYREVEMLTTMLMAKLHRVVVTRADLHYEGSCGIDANLLERSGIREYQQIDIYNVENGERLTTYAIRSPHGSGEICLNGAAARKAMVGDHLIIVAYNEYSEADLVRYRPVIVMVDEKNHPIDNGAAGQTELHAVG